MTGNEKKEEPNPGVHPTPEKLTPLGAPVDDRFPETGPKDMSLKAEQPKEEPADKRSSKSEAAKDEEDDTKKKRR